MGLVPSRSRASKYLRYVLSALLWKLSIATKEISNMGPGEGEKKVKERRQREEKGTLLSCFCARGFGPIISFSLHDNLVKFTDDEIEAQRH